MWITRDIEPRLLQSARTRGELELSTNLAENSMRPVALGRNYAQSVIMYSG